MSDALMMLATDPRYGEATGFLQTGNWQQAIENLKALQEDYPDNAVIEESLRQAAASSGASMIRHRATSKPARAAIAWMRAGLPIRIKSTMPGWMAAMHSMVSVPSAIATATESR